MTDVCYDLVFPFSMVNQSRTHAICNSRSKLTADQPTSDLTYYAVK